MIIKILLDECLPKKLKYRVEELDPNFLAKTVPEMDWASITNGALLEKAEREFDVFLASDRNLSFQQEIETSDIHVILLKASTNIYEDLLPLVKKLTPIIQNFETGKFQEVE